MRKLLLATAISLAFVSQAGAQNAAVAALAPMMNWSGCYIGASVGIGRLRDVGHDLFRGVITREQPIGTQNLESTKFGAFAGCNLQTGVFVLGVEGDIETSGFRGGADYANTGGPPPDSYTIRSNFQGSVRGRLGLAFDRSMIYATAGTAVARISHIYFQNGNGSTQEFTHDRWGATVGFGLENAFTPNIIGRLEYRYGDFGSVTNTTRIYAAGYQQYQANFEHAVRAAVMFKF
jgi:outer membrane immunogenic protein